MQRKHRIKTVKTTTLKKNNQHFSKPVWFYMPIFKVPGMVARFNLYFSNGLVFPDSQHYCCAVLHTTVAAKLKITLTLNSPFIFN